MIFLEEIYEKLEPFEKLQKNLREKDREINSIILEVLYDGKANKKQLKKVGKIAKEISENYKSMLSYLIELNEEIKSSLKSFLSELKDSYLVIEHRVKPLNSFLEKIIRKNINSIFTPYKQNRNNDILAFRIITLNKTDSYGIAEDIKEFIINTTYPFEFYYKRKDPLVLLLDRNEIKLNSVVYDNLNEEAKLNIYYLENVSKENYRTIEKQLQHLFDKRKVNIPSNFTKSVYTLPYYFKMGKELIMFYSEREKELYLIINSSFSNEEGYKKFLRIIDLIKKKGINGLSKLDMGKEYLGRVPYGLYKIDYLEFFEPLGFELKELNEKDIKTIKTGIENSGVIIKQEICSFDNTSSIPLLEIQILDYHSNLKRERSLETNHKSYEEKRINKIKENLFKIKEEYGLDERRLNHLTQIIKEFIPNFSLKN